MESCHPVQWTDIGERTLRPTGANPTTTFPLLLFFQQQIFVFKPHVLLEHSAQVRTDHAECGLLGRSAHVRVDHSVHVRVGYCAQVKVDHCTSITPVELSGMESTR